MSIELPPEPWYYGFLNLAARLGLAIGGGQFLVVFMVGVQGGLPMSLGSTAAVVAWSFGGALVSVIGGAFLLLAVDAARNVRETRYARPIRTAPPPATPSRATTP